MTASPTLSPTLAPVEDYADQSYIMATLICFVLFIMSCMLITFLLHSKSVSITQKLQYYEKRKTYIKYLNTAGITYTDPMNQSINDNF